jgi:hypothetical protein
VVCDFLSFSAAVSNMFTGGWVSVGCVVVVVVSPVCFTALDAKNAKVDHGVLSMVRSFGSLASAPVARFQSFKVQSFKINLQNHCWDT